MLSSSARLTDVGTLLSEESYRGLMQRIYEAVQNGMAPWEPGRIALYRTDDFSGEPEIAIRVERLPDLIFKTTFNYWLIDPAEMVLDAAEKAFKFYRYRETLPIEDHIILGEG